MGEKETQKPEQETGAVEETEVPTGDNENVELQPEVKETELPAEKKTMTIPPSRETTASEENHINYLSASRLESITTVTPGELETMEDPESVRRDEELEKLYKTSIGDIREDEVLKGRVIGMSEREVLVDIGFKSEGVIPREEFVSEDLPQIGDEIEVYLVRMEDASGQTLLSKEKADFMKRWSEIREVSETGTTIRGRIVRRIKGGMVVDLNGVPAFLPGSQIDIRPVQDFDEYVGEEFEFKIVKLNESRKNIVLSRKYLLEADLAERRHSLIQDLEVGRVLEGRVKNITDFGVFVDLGGLDGLLHITDLSWGRVSHPSEIVQLNETINVKVIDFDPEKQRVSLGLKQLQPHPWESVELKYPVDSTVTGKIVSMTNYGVFIEIEKGVEGLVHVSEMSWTRHIRHPSEMFSLGQVIEAKILSVDVEERKISLGVKQLQPDPWDEIEEKYPVGSLQKGLVRNLTQFGAFVELEEGIDGLIHITDLSWTKNVRHPKEILNKGNEVEVRVLDVSRENRRIALGLKQVHEDPWEKIESFFTTGKKVRGQVIRVLDKGIILDMEMDMEGIIPMRDLPKRERKQHTAHLKTGDILEATVQELSVDDKKVVLMPDLETLRPVEATEEEVEEVERKPKTTKAKKKAAEKVTTEVTEEASAEAKEESAPEPAAESEVAVTEEVPEKGPETEAKMAPVDEETEETVEAVPADATKKPAKLKKAEKTASPSRESVSVQSAEVADETPVIKTPKSRKTERETVASQLSDKEATETPSTKKKTSTSKSARKELKTVETVSKTDRKSAVKEPPTKKSKRSQVKTESTSTPASGKSKSVRPALPEEEEKSESKVSVKKESVKATVDKKKRTGTRKSSSGTKKNTSGK